MKQFIASEINSPIQAPLDQFLSQQAIHQPLHGGVNGNYFSLKPLKVFVIVTVFELVFLLVRSCFHIFGEGVILNPRIYIVDSCIFGEKFNTIYKMCLCGRRVLCNTHKILRILGFVFFNFTHAIAKL